MGNRSRVSLDVYTRTNRVQILLQIYDNQTLIVFEMNNYGYEVVELCNLYLFLKRKCFQYNYLSVILFHIDNRKFQGLQNNRNI